MISLWARRPRPASHSLSKFGSARVSGAERRTWSDAAWHRSQCTVWRGEARRAVGTCRSRSSSNSSSIRRSISAFDSPHVPSPSTQSSALTLAAGGGGWRGEPASRCVCVCCCVAVCVRVYAGEASDEHEVTGAARTCALLADGAHLKNGIGPDDSPMMTTASASRGIQPNLGALGSRIPAGRTAAPQHEQNFPWPFTTPSCPHAPQRSRSCPAVMDMVVPRADEDPRPRSHWLHAGLIDTPPCSEVPASCSGAWILRIHRWRAGACRAIYRGCSKQLRDATGRAISELRDHGGLGGDGRRRVDPLC